MKIYETVQPTIKYFKENFLSLCVCFVNASLRNQAIAGPSSPRHWGGRDLPTLESFFHHFVGPYCCTWLHLLSCPDYCILWFCTGCRNLWESSSRHHNWAPVCWRNECLFSECHNLSWGCWKYSQSLEDKILVLLQYKKLIINIRWWKYGPDLWLFFLLLFFWLLFS